MDGGITCHEDEAGAEQTAEEVRSHGHRAVVEHLDATDVPGCGDVVDKLIGQLDGLDVFVNNAGTGINRLVLDTCYEDWRRTVLTDLDGAFVCLQRAARHMVCPCGPDSPSLSVASLRRRLGLSRLQVCKHSITNHGQNGRGRQNCRAGRRGGGGGTCLAAWTSSSAITTSPVRVCTVHSVSVTPLRYPNASVKPSGIR